MSAEIPIELLQLSVLDKTEIDVQKSQNKKLFVTCDPLGFRRKETNANFSETNDSKPVESYSIHVMIPKRDPKT